MFHLPVQQFSYLLGLLDPGPTGLFKRCVLMHTPYATDQLPEIPTQRCVGVGIKTGEAGLGGLHLAEAMGGKSRPHSRQSAASGRLKAETKNPFLQDAAC